jgi:hypothetical protein
MEEARSFKNVRIGVFNSVEHAEHAVAELREAGFDNQELGVLCSQRHLEKHFGLPEPAQARVHSTETIATGGAVGASIGGIALAVSALTTGGASLLIGGALLLAGGAIAGSFAGAIYGIEKARADYYEQALQKGSILIVVEVKDEHSTARLDKAQRILSRAGAKEVEAVGGYP